MDPQLLKENQALCGPDRKPVYEAVKARGAAGERSVDLGFKSESVWKPVPAEKLAGVLEAIKSGKLKERHAKVGHADRINANYRIYPLAVWNDQVETFTPKMLDAGNLCGAVDHLGWDEGGNLKHTCIIWTGLEIKADGAVMSSFVIVEDHSDGKDFKAQCDAGMNVGFSTYGYGTGHQPGEAERKEYGLSDDAYAVIMDRNFQLKKIDAVDDPSVHDARLVRSEEVDGIHGQRESTQNPPGGGSAERQMKTLEELKSAHPAVFALHEAALGQAIAGKDQKIKDLEAANKRMADAVNPLLVALKENAAIVLPQREVLPGETAERIKTLEGQKLAAEQAKTAAESAKDAAEAKVKEAEAKVKAAADEKIARERSEKLLAKAAPLLKDNRFKDEITPELTAKIAGDAGFDESKVDAFVTERATHWEAVAKKFGAPAGVKKVEGKNVSDDDLDDDEVDVEDTDKPLAGMESFKPRKQAAAK